MSDGFAYRLRAVHVVFGTGSLARLAEVVTDAGLGRVLLVTTPGRRDTAAVATRALGDVVAGVLDGAAPHVPASLVADALREVERLQPDGTVAIGGGSAIGLGKALALRAGLPLVAVPTTYSGSEMTDVWGITAGDQKETGRDARVAPRSVVYDAGLTVSMPAALSAASGMNALAHCVEALYAPDRHPVSALLAREGIRILAASLPDVVRSPFDGGARERALFGAHLAGRALDLTSMGLHHKLCHVLGGTFGLPHAMTHAVLLPYVTACNASAAGRAMAEIATALGGETAWTGLHALRQALGITTTLRDLGLDAKDLDRAADLAVAGAYANPRPVTRDEVRDVLQAAYSGAPPRPE